MNVDPIVLITGGSRGIGAATAILAGKQGWSVTLSYIGNEKAAKETATAVEKPTDCSV